MTDTKKHNSITCAACQARLGISLASGPPMCKFCLHSLQQCLNAGGIYLCSSINRRQDVIFAEPPAQVLSGCYRNLSYENSTYSIKVSTPDQAPLLLPSSINRVIIWTGAGLTMASGLSPSLPPVANQRTHEDYDRALTDLSLPHSDVTHNLLLHMADCLEQSKNIKTFVVSSNVDGFLSKIGFSDRISEVHGSVRYLQCSAYQDCGDSTLYSTRCERPQLCLSCGTKLRVAVTTAQDEDDDLVLTRHGLQVEAFRKILEVRAGNDTIIHLVVGVGPTNRDSLTSEILLLQQHTLPQVNHVSVWFNQPGYGPPSGLSNAIDIHGNIAETLPIFIKSWLGLINEDEEG